MTDWATQQEVLGFDLGTERMTISLPARMISEFQKMLEDWPDGGRTVMVREVLVLAGKLNHVAYVSRPGRYFVRRLPQLSKLHLNGQENSGGERPGAVAVPGVDSFSGHVGEGGEGGASAVAQVR